MSISGQQLMFRASCRHGRSCQQELRGFVGTEHGVDTGERGNSQCQLICMKKQADQEDGVQEPVDADFAHNRIEPITAEAVHAI